MALSKEDKQEIKKMIHEESESIRKLIDFHIQEIQPFLDGWKGGKLIGNMIKWFAGLIIAIAGALAVITHIK